MQTDRTKFTVYLEPGELLEIDRAVLELRASYGIKIDRGRYVLEALRATSVPDIAARIAEGD